jgi:pimeloyl-ACP methyl ester carboxylesterase
LSQRSDEFHKRGWATVITEIPGTADCPSNRTDPSSPDRLFSSILDWIDAQDYLDSSKIIAWGLSAGGYYAIRLAHTHHSRLLGVIGQGAGTHHFLSREWLEKVDGHEYPFKLSHAYLAKYGYKSWDELMTKAQKEYSLIDNGILKGPSCRLLLVNGVNDGLMPIEDSMLCMNYGRPKEGRFYEGTMHMGYPPANECVWPWMEEVMRSMK